MPHEFSRTLPLDAPLGARALLKEVMYGEAGAPGRLVNDPQRARAADALLEVWKESCRGGGGREAWAAVSAEESALTKSRRSGRGGK